jgi:hypothetical protein
MSPARSSRSAPGGFVSLASFVASIMLRLSRPAPVIAQAQRPRCPASTHQRGVSTPLAGSSIPSTVRPAHAGGHGEAGSAAFPTRRRTTREGSAAGGWHLPRQGCIPNRSGRRSVDCESRLAVPTVPRGEAPGAATRRSPCGCLWCDVGDAETLVLARLRQCFCLGNREVLIGTGRPFNHLRLRRRQNR